MKMTDSQRLLADYAATCSELAFRELLARYVDLVYSAAVRLVGGDTHLVQDVTQTVFVDLARKARALPRDVMLGGWLHHHTVFVAASAMRRERRRHLRERKAAEMNALQDHTEANLARVAPILDEAIDELGTKDRAAILLRFFEQLDFRSVGEMLGSNEDAARKRVTRALEKLHALLKHRGVGLSAAALGAALSTEAVMAAPAGLALSLAGPALAGAVSGGGVGFILLKFSSMKLKLGIASALMVAALATPFVIQHPLLARLREENQGLRQYVGQMDQLETENQRLSNLLVESKSAQFLSGNQLSELLRLRNEVGQLRQAKSKLETARSESDQSPAASSPPPPKIDFYYVGGGVSAPGRQLYLQPGLTVTAAIRAAGGLTDEAVKTRVELLRAGSDQQSVIDLTAIEQGHAPDPEIMPGDRVHVPMPPPWYAVEGAGIAIPGRRPFQPDLTVTAAIKAAGGFTDEAVQTKVELVRVGNERPIVIDLTVIEQGNAPDPEILPGDKLMVPSSPPRDP